MVIRSRLRSFLIPLVLYVVSGSLVAYFVLQAHQGSRGLEAKRALKIDIYRLNQELAEVKANKAEWQRRIDLLAAEEVDRDLLDERARMVLGRAHANDVVVLIPQRSK